MKRVFLVAVAAFVLTLSSNAQTERKKDTTGQKVMRQMSQQKAYGNLDLTQTQKDQLKRIREENMKERKAIQNDASLTGQQKSEKIKALNKSQQEKSQQLLTQEQREKMKTSQKKQRMDNRAMGKKGQENRGKNFKNQANKSDAGLTMEQKDKLKTIRKDNVEQRKAIQSDQSLTNEQKSEKLKALNKNMKEQMDAVLTPTQKEQMKKKSQYNKTRTHKGRNAR